MIKQTVSFYFLIWTPEFALWLQSAKAGEELVPAADSLQEPCESHHSYLSPRRATGLPVCSPRLCAKCYCGQLC